MSACMLARTTRRSERMLAGWERALVKSRVPALTRQPRRVVADVTVRAFEDRVGSLATRGGAPRHRVRERAQRRGGQLGVTKEVLVDLHARSCKVVRGHQRSSEVIRGHQGSSEVIRGHQRSSEVIRGHQAPGRFEARQRARAPSWRRRSRRGAGSRRTCTPSMAIMYAHVCSCMLMYAHVCSCVILCPRQSAADMHRISVPVGKARLTHASNQRTGWESEGYAARGRRSCTRPSLGR